ncbi:KEOPS complex subunit Cgi121 [Methanocella conradii]|uniref:KEOPS complex subunit Cgi121 n=1 Tax=Methanocella conradii TaxID=1175444 RepID=UPI0024B348D1|nr:KEOPS complex subunit Cgi121 [Methanocella conradii]MDI6896944.1 KEOPS complex subunit Cgi121 [Methanocella conradii]
MTGLIIVGGRVEIKDVRAFIARLAAIGKEYNVTVQAVNADLIAGRGHLEYAVSKAMEAFQNKTNLARDPGMEIMLYLRGKRQIEKALEMGVHPGMNNVAIAIVGDGAEDARDKVLSLLDEVDDKVVDYDHKKDEALMRLYDITSAEVEIVGRERIPLLARERSALLEFEK